MNPRPPGSTSRALVTAVVVNWNGVHYLEECLRSILEQDPPPAEVIVADNHSSDGSREFVAEHFPGVKVVDTGHNGGPGRARNVGVEHASQELVLLVDNDVVLRPGVLAQLTRTREAHGRAIVQARSLCHDRPDVVHYDHSELHFLGLLLLRNFFRPLAEATAHDEPAGGMVGLCVLLSREQYAAIGGFHEEFFFYFEDTDFALRARMSGHEIRVDAGALVLHRGGTADLSMRDSAAMPEIRTYYHSRNRWILLLTCLRLRSLLVLLPAQLVYAAVHFAFAVSKGHGIAWWRGKWGVVRLLPQIRRWRRVSQRTRVVRDRDLLVAKPMTLNPGIAEGGAARVVRRTLDRFYALYWKLARPLCG